MNHFINHLLSRHNEPDNNLKPRVRGRFEPATHAPGIFAGDDPKAFTDDHFTRQPEINNIDQTVSLPEERLRPALSVKPTAASDPAMTSWKPRQETETVHTHPFPAFFPPYSTGRENRIHHQGETEDTLEGNKPSSVVQPAGWLVQEKGSVHEKIRNPEELFLKNNDENQRAGFTDRKVSAIHADSSAETVQPVLKKYNTNDTESSPDALPGLLGLRHFHAPPVQIQHEANQPVIKVTIGRIDVRAVVQATSAPLKSTAAAKPKLSLEEYLKQRNNKTT